MLSICGCKFIFLLVLNNNNKLVHVSFAEDVQQPKNMYNIKDQLYPAIEE